MIGIGKASIQSYCCQEPVRPTLTKLNGHWSGECQARRRRSRGRQAGQCSEERRGEEVEKRKDWTERGGSKGVLNSQGLVSSLVGGVGRPASIEWLGHCIALRPASFPVAWAQGVACNRGHWLGHIQARCFERARDAILYYWGNKVSRPACADLMGLHRGGCHGHDTSPKKAWACDRYTTGTGT